MLKSVILSYLLWASFLCSGQVIEKKASNLDSCREYNAFYYQVGGKYPESSVTTLENVHTFLKTKHHSYSGSGYITFRFIVNCNGEIRRESLEVLQIDAKYIHSLFDKEFVVEITEFLFGLKKWHVPKDKKGFPFSYKAFLSFKIQNGKIVNIIP